LDDEAGPQVAVSGTEEMTFSRRKATLLVDDDKLVLLLMTMMLEELGCTVVAKTDGYQAVKVFEHDPQRFELVILDYGLAGITGLEVAVEIASIRKDVPLILLTCHADPALATQAKVRGVSECVTKPVSGEEIGQILSRVLRNVSLKPEPITAGPYPATAKGEEERKWYAKE
jgi:CheY-like chemotaxis protein